MTTQLSLRQNLQGDAFKNRLASVLPAHMTPERMVAVTLTALSRTPALAGPDVDQASFFKAMMLLSEVGLEPNGTHAHLIPFWNSKRQCREVQLILDYKGLVLLARRAGYAVESRVVYANDSLEYEGTEVTRHVPSYLLGKDETGEIIAFYCRVSSVDPNVNDSRVEFMSRAEVDRVRDASRSSSHGPWKDHYAEMGRKTVFRRAAKYIAFEAKTQQAILSGDDDVPITITAQRAKAVDVEEFKAMLDVSHQSDDQESQSSPVTHDE
jgi:recombination protein RecT